MITATVKRNTDQNGIEIYFDGGIPSVKTRTQLKEHHWRFHKLKKCWYIYYTTENMNFANRIKNQHTLITTYESGNKSSSTEMKRKKVYKYKKFHGPISIDWKSAHIPDIIHEKDINVDSIHKERRLGEYQPISPKDKRYQRKRSFFS